MLSIVYVSGCRLWNLFNYELELTSKEFLTNPESRIRTNFGEMIINEIYIILESKELTLKLNELSMSLSDTNMMSVLNFWIIIT